jgi:hypothetical protein
MLIDDSLAVTAFVTDQPRRGTVFATIGKPGKDRHDRTVVNAVISCDRTHCQKHAGETLIGVIDYGTNGEVVLHWFGRRDQYGCQRPIAAPDIPLTREALWNLNGASMPLPESAFPTPSDPMTCSLASIEAR